MLSAIELSIWRPPFREWLRKYPEWPASALVCVAWCIVVSEFDTLRVFDHPETPMRHGGLGRWMVMTVAMMGPAALAGVRHTAVSSLSWRRGRAILEFASAYLAQWVLFGAAMLGLLSALRIAPGWNTLAIVLAIAAAWQLTPLKKRCLRDCHRSIPLPPTGWRADRAALKFGLLNGLACVGSCWGLMLVMTVVPSGHLWWSIALTAVVTTERMLERPYRATRRHAFGLALAASIASIVSEIT
jgi:predicted metal-binding membrane protein